MTGRLWPVEAAGLRFRTLANLHAALDAAVAAAYGWPAGTAEDEALAALLALNRERAPKPA